MFRGSASVITFAQLMSALKQLLWLKNMVCMVTLIFSPHASHKLQLLERGVFGPLKKYNNAACSNWMISNPGKPITI